MRDSGSSTPHQIPSNRCKRSNVTPHTPTFPRQHATAAGQPPPAVHAPAQYIHTFASGHRGARVQGHDGGANLNGARTHHTHVNVNVHFLADNAHSVRFRLLHGASTAAPGSLTPNSLAIRHQEPWCGVRRHCYTPPVNVWRGGASVRAVRHSHTPCSTSSSRSAANPWCTAAQRRPNG